MSKGENIFKRKDGRWEARYKKGYDASGKIRYGYCYAKTYAEAKEKVTRQKAAVISGIADIPYREKHRISYFCDEWLRMRRNRCKESTVVKYETILVRHIKPQFGHCRPEEITSERLEDFVEHLHQKGLAPKTVRDILMVLRSVLNSGAGANGARLPACEIRYPKEPKKEMRVLSKEEQERLTAYLTSEMDACRFGVLLALMTGIRLGELCALQWNAVSIRDQTLRITATMQRLHDRDGSGEAKTRIIVGEPKSDMSVRTIPLPESVTELCRKTTPGLPEAYILTGTTDYMEPRTLQYRFRRYTEDCGLEGVHFHTLRHTFATRCIEVGFDLKSLSEILGHASPTITLNRYVHSSMELKKENMKKLNALAL